MLNPESQAFADAIVGLVGDVPAGRLGARQVLEALPVAVFTTDPHGYLTFFNPAAAGLWGRSPELYVDRYTGAWRLWNDDGAEVAPARCTLARALREGQSIPGEEGVIERPDGSRVHVLAMPTLLFDDAGRLAGAVNIVFDITVRRQAVDQLRESEAHYRHFIEVNPSVFWTADPEGHVTIGGDAAAARLGSVTNLPDLNDYGAWVHPHDRDQVRAATQISLQTGEPLDFVCRFRMAGDRYRWIRTRAHAQRDADGRIRRWYGSSEDIHHRKLAEEALARAQERLTLALDGNKVGVWDWNVAAGTNWFSNSIYAQLGYQRGDLDDGDISVDHMAHPDDRVALKAMLREAVRGDIENFVAEYRVRSKGGAWIWIADRGKVAERDADGRATRIVGTRTDISDRKFAEERVRWLAGHDALTGLPNRRLFQEELGSQIERAAATGESLGLLLLDLNDFKSINDNLGHDAGDALLRSLATRLAKADCGFIARLGGDEFAVILPRATGDADFHRAIGTVREQLREPFVYGGRAFDCSVSIGASLYPAHGSDPDELLKSADIALYAAKSQEGPSSALYDPAMRSAVLARAAMVRTARAAADADRIRPFYQPKVALSSGRIAGFEALLRWRDKSSFRSPGEIIAAFDDLEAARALSERMLGKLVDDMRAWLDAGVDFGHVAINASPAEFRSGDLADRILGRLAAAGIPPSRLELEVTETVFMGRGSDCVERALAQLSEAGVRIALDDFGTGYASLTHLKQFPVDIIKIDQSFIRDLEDDPYDAAIVRAVLNLGQSLKVDIVAEGIETSAQAAYLWAQGCGYGQGYLFGKPVASAKLPKLLAEWTPGRRWKGAF